MKIQIKFASFNMRTNNQNLVKPKNTEIGGENITVKSNGGSIQATFRNFGTTKNYLKATESYTNRF